MAQKFTFQTPKIKNLQMRKMSSESESESEIKFEDADLYEKFMGPWTEMIGSQFINWMSPAKGKSWVDVGCGAGGFAAQIIEKCSPTKVDGIDPSDAQVDFAKKRDFTVPVNFQTGDAMELPYQSDSFDYGMLDFILAFKRVN